METFVFLPKNVFILGKTRLSLKQEIINH